jgi:3-isopropylmalate/(R)-2-methylmalate dehydratase small subunit
MNGRMSGRVDIRGAAFTIDGNVDTDTIIKSRHCTSADPRALAPYCLAELAGEPPFGAGGAYPVIFCRGTFGIGSARIQAPLALAGAGVKAVLARAFAPIFFENCVNGAILLPLTATLDKWPTTGTPVELAVSDGEFVLSWQGEHVTLPCAMPEWALAGQSWMDVIEQRAQAAGGLEALRARLRTHGWA